MKKLADKKVSKYYMYTEINDNLESNGILMPGAENANGIHYSMTTRNHSDVQ